MAALSAASRQENAKNHWMAGAPINFEQLAGEFSNPASNLGVLLGEPSGGLYDTDIDCPEAAAVADALLPRTSAEFRRRSKPRSHRLYICAGAKEATKQFRDPTLNNKDDKSMLIELRGTGGQTMFPPSVHPSGERVQWHSQDIGPAAITYDELNRAVAKTARGGFVGEALPGRRFTQSSGDGSGGRAAGRRPGGGGSRTIYRHCRTRRW